MPTSLMPPFFSRTMDTTDPTATVSSRALTAWRRLLSLVPSSGGSAASCADLESLSRGASAYLCAFPDASDARDVLGHVWDTVALLLANGSPMSLDDRLTAVLALYHVAYGPSTPPQDYSRASWCDSLASRLVDEALNVGTASPEVLLPVMSELYRYVVPEDMDGETAPEYFRTTAAEWERERVSGTVPEETSLRRLSVLESGSGLFLERMPSLPPARSLCISESLSWLCSALARRLGPSGPLRSACSLLESSMPPSPPASVCASLVEGLCALELAASGERS